MHRRRRKRLGQIDPLNADKFTIEELREKLRGVTWGTFVKNSKCVINNVVFVARVGVFMRRPVFAVLAGKRFVVVRMVVPKWYDWRWQQVIDPSMCPAYGGHALWSLGNATRFNINKLPIKTHMLVIDDDTLNEGTEGQTEGPDVG